MRRERSRSSRNCTPRARFTVNKFMTARHFVCWSGRLWQHIIPNDIVFAVKRTCEIGPSRVIWMIRVINSERVLRCLPSFTLKSAQLSPSWSSGSWIAPVAINHCWVMIQSRVNYIFDYYSNEMCYSGSLKSTRKTIMMSAEVLCVCYAFVSYADYMCCLLYWWKLFPCHKMVLKHLNVIIYCFCKKFH